LKNNINFLDLGLQPLANNYLSKKGNQDLEKKVLLQSIDINWKNHVQYLEQLRQVIGLRSYGQRDPLVEYKKETFDLFEELLIKIRQNTILILLNLKIVNNQEINNFKDKKNNKTKVINKKIGRNDPCICGSKKKYKHCCGATI